VRVPLKIREPGSRLAEGAGRCGGVETEGAGRDGFRGSVRSARVPLKMREPGSRLAEGAGRCGGVETEGAGRDCCRETDEENGCETRGAGMRYGVFGDGTCADRG